MRAIHLPIREIHSVGERTRETLLGPSECTVLVRHGIRLLGCSDAWPGFAFHRVSPPPIAQVLVTLGGRGDVLTAGGWESSGPGSAYVTPAGVPHAYHAVDDSEAWRVCWVTYAAEARAFAVAEPTLLAAVETQTLASAVRGLLAEARGACDPAMMAAWAGLADACARRIGASLNAAEPRLERLFAEVAAEPAHPWTLNEMAARARVSGEHLRRLCHARFGRSPLQQVAHLRMKHAATLLASGRYTIERAAEAVGYTNPFAFSAAFKRTQGCPPSQLRNGGPPAPPAPGSDNDQDP